MKHLLPLVFAVLCLSINKVSVDEATETHKFSSDRKMHNAFWWLPPDLFPQGTFHEVVIPAPEHDRKVKSVEITFTDDTWVYFSAANWLQTQLLDVEVFETWVADRLRIEEYGPDIDLKEVRGDLGTYQLDDLSFTDGIQQTETQEHSNSFSVKFEDDDVVNFFDNLPVDTPELTLKIRSMSLYDVKYNHDVFLHKLIVFSLLKGKVTYTYCD